MDDKNEIRRKIFVSYRTTDKISNKLIKALEEKAKGIKCKILYDDKKSDSEYEVCYDKKDLKPGDSISKFMAELSETDRIVFLVSKDYFQSPSCMYELLSAYEKQARDLQPTVVLLDNFLLDNKQEEKDTWNEYAEMIPIILAWLFGKYESGLNYRDRQVLKHNNEEKYDETAEKIIEWLDKEIEPVRYNHLAVRERRGIIKDKLKSGLENIDFNEPLIKLLKQNVDCSGDLLESLALMKNAAILSKALESIHDFLEEVKKDNNFKPSPTFKNMVEEFTGLLLVAAVDDKKLHQIIHELNHRGDAARNEFDPENILNYQILVCAFFNKPAIYTVENKVPIGEGEVKLIETGMNKESFKRFINDDLEYMTEFESLINKVRKVSRPNTANSPYRGDDEAKRKRINKVMAKLGKFYIAVEKDKLNLLGEKLFNKIGKKFPPLVQIFMREREKDPLFELFIPGFEDEENDIGDEINIIYSLLKDIPNWR